MAPPVSTYYYFYILTYTIDCLKTVQAFITISDETAMEITEIYKKSNGKKEIIKREIIEKSREIIARLGYKKSSTEEIARSLNKTKASLYHYFKNREEILQAVIDYEGKGLKDVLINTVNSGDNPPIKLQSFFKARAKKIFELWNFYKFVISEYFNRYSFIMGSLNEYNDKELFLVKSIIQDGIERGMFSVSNVELTSKALIKSMKGYDFFLFQGEHFNDIEDELTETLKIFVNGISKK